MSSLYASRASSADESGNDNADVTGTDIGLGVGFSIAIPIAIPDSQILPANADPFMNSRKNISVFMLDPFKPVMKVYRCK